MREEIIDNAVLRIEMGLQQHVLMATIILLLAIIIVRD